jgi:cytidine deaminase
MEKSNQIIQSESLISLVLAAQNAAKLAYCKYSQFAVGCALRTKTGKIYQGCNIENASYPASICAERVASVQAILHQDYEWDSLVVVSSQRVTTCGICRQFLHEFAPELKVWNGFLDNVDLVGPVLLKQLLPAGMTLDTDAIHRSHS